MLRKCRALSANRDDERSARLDLLHVADRLFENMPLCRHRDDGDVLFYQRDRSVLKLARRVRLGVHVGYLLELQRTFQRQRVIKSAPDKEQRFRVHELRRDKLALPAPVDNVLYRFRSAAELCREPLHLGLVDSPAGERKSERQQIQRRDLHGIRLGGRDRDLGTRESVYADIRQPCYRGVFDVHHRESFRAARLRELQSRLGVRGLARLRHDYNEILLAHYRIHVSEFARYLAGNGNTRELLNGVPRHYPRVHRRTARRYVHSPNSAKKLVGKSDIREVGNAVTGETVERFLYDLGLLVDLLEHIVREAELLRLFDVPFGGLALLAYLYSVHVEEHHAVRIETHYLVVLKQNVILCVLEKRGDIARDEALALADPDDERASAPRRVDALGEVLEDYPQSVAPAKLLYRFGNGVERISLRVVIIEHASHYLAVRLRKERVAFFREELLKLRVILDYAVVDYGNAPV